MSVIEVSQILTFINFYVCYANPARNLSSDGVKCSGSCGWGVSPLVGTAALSDLPGSELGRILRIIGWTILSDQYKVRIFGNHYAVLFWLSLERG